MGRTSLSILSVAAASRRGLLTAWIDGDCSLDPVSLDCAGAVTGRILWVRGPFSFHRALKAAEEVLKTGGFEVCVVRTPDPGAVGTAGWVRLARAVERTRSVLISIEHGRSTPIPGSVQVNLAPGRCRWAGTPGVSSVLVGADVAVRTVHGSAGLTLDSKEVFCKP